MTENNFKEQTEIIKGTVKDLAKNETSLKSISFSLIEDKLEFVIYFTWEKENYTNFNTERKLFRDNVKHICKSYYFLFNIQKSTSSKFIFNKIYIPKNAHFSTNI